MADAACVPGDFERQSALLLGCNELLPYHPRALLDMASILLGRIPLIGIVDSEEQRRQLLVLLCDWGLPAHLMRFVSLPVKGMWVRDYGPSFVRRPGGGITILDAEYLEVDRRNDDAAPTELASLLRLPVEHVPLTIEGGNLLSNGRGLCLTTTTTITRNAFRGLGADGVTRALARHYGFEEVVTLRPLLSEPTGHVDMFATFVSPDTVVVGEYDPRIDPVNADVLNHNAFALSRLTVDGKPLRVVRVPMPTNRGSVWRTYTNVVYANGTLLVPTYGHVDPAGEQRAMDTYAALLPEWDIAGIDACSIVRQRGALRCVTIGIPWLENVFDDIPVEPPPPPPAAGNQRIRRRAAG